MKPFDQLAKDLLQTLLAAEHVVQTQREVRHEAQHIDVFSAPRSPGAADAAARFDRLGWLARMAVGAACFEAHAGAVRRSQLLHARRRQLAAWHELSGGKARGTIPLLWLLSAGRAPRLEQHFALGSRPGWPTAFRFSNAGERWCLVLLHDLPGGRATLPLRALGRGTVQRTALQEIAALPATDPLRGPLTEVCARNFTAVSLESEDTMDPENLDVLRDIVEQRERELADKARRDGRDEGLRDGLSRGRADGLRDGRNEGLRDGRNEGRAEGLRAALRATLAARGLSPSAAQLQAIDECDAVALLERWVARAAVATDSNAMFDSHEH